MDVQTAIADAIAVLESPAAQAAIDVATTTAPPPVGTAIGIAVRVVPPLVKAVSAFLTGKIDHDQLQASWTKMVADGALADAAVAHGEVLRQAQAAQPASPTTPAAAPPAPAAQ